MQHGNFQLSLTTMDRQLYFNITTIFLLEHQKIGRSEAIFSFCKSQNIIDLLITKLFLNIENITTVVT